MKNKGLTLIELAVVVVIVAIATLAITMHFVSEQRFRTNVQEKINIGKEARIAMNHMVRVLRFASEDAKFAICDVDADDDKSTNHLSDPPDIGGDGDIDDHDYYQFTNALQDPIDGAWCPVAGGDNYDPFYDTDGDGDTDAVDLATLGLLYGSDAVIIVTSNTIYAYIEGGHMSAVPSHIAIQYRITNNTLFYTIKAAPKIEIPIAYNVTSLAGSAFDRDTWTLTLNLTVQKDEQVCNLQTKVKILGSRYTR